MCMALPGGNRDEPPTTPLQKMKEWAGFIIVLGAFFASGLLRWVQHRLLQH